MFYSSSIPPIFMTHRTFLRLQSIALAFSMFTLMLPGIALAFSDVKVTSSQSQAIDTLQERGIVQGFSDGSFRPNHNITRAEFLKIVLEARAEDQNVALKPSTGCFDDARGHWAEGYICQAKAEGIVSGYSMGEFKPNQNVNFIEAGKMLALAFKQDKAEAVGGLWYEPHVLALESSKAIPATITSLIHTLTRGEMAEMIWRLTDNRTDQPTKGYLNITHPELSINAASDSVQLAKSCTDIKVFSEQQNQVTMRRGGGMMLEGAPVPMMMDTFNTKAVESAAGAAQNDYSQTNVQVQGVDEADIVKTDGTYLYIADSYEGQKVRIVKARPGSALAQTSVIDLANEGMTPSELYVDGNTLIIVGNFWNPVIMDSTRTQSADGVVSKMIAPGYYPQTQKTQVRIYDIANKSSPTLKRTVSIDGSQVSTRRIGTKLYLVLNQPTYWWGNPIPLLRSATEKDLLPTFSDTAKKIVDQPVTRCVDVSILPHVPSPQYITVAVIPTDSVTAEVKREVILGNAQNIYMSLRNLYVANPEYRYSWDGTGSTETKTNVYRFAVENDGVALKSQGSVVGTILNQFSMDEHENTFRIATTKEGTWTPNYTQIPSSNQLYVLGMDMQIQGKIEDIAPGERIYSVRFLGDRAYMVTFKKADPLFVIDTSSPRNPKILGKLKIPGYSDYLHPYDENHIIGFGKEAVAAKEGDFAWYQGMKIALFDVTDVANPKEMFTEVIGDRGTESPLLQNHKALLFEKDRNLLAFPVTVAKITDAQRQQQGDMVYGPHVFQGAYVYELTLDDGFDLQGKISHYSDEDYLKAGDNFYLGGKKDVQRIIRIGNSLLTVSAGMVQSHTEAGLQEEGSVVLK